MVIKPYSNDYMIYDELTHRYVLTEAAILQKFGIDLRVAAKDNPNGVTAILDTVSNMVYQRIHDANVCAELQDRIIACTSAGREIVYRAMLEQFIYVKTVGDLRRTTDRSKRDLWFDMNAETILETVIPETGKSLLYAGIYGFVPFLQEC